jgi:uncharacterized membrane protein YhiD involved in acid resistance
MGEVVRWFVDGWRGAWLRPGPAGDELENVLFVRLAVAVALGSLVALTRTLVRSDGRPSPGLRTTLLLLTVLTALITEVIGNSVARAFGLAGALAVVRFRTAVEDTRDSAFVIFAMASGMAVGAGYLTTALLGAAVVAAVAVTITRLAGPPEHDGKLEVRVRGPATTAARLREVVERYSMSVLLSAAGTGKDEECVEYEFKFRPHPRADLPKMVAELRALPGVDKAGWELK